MKNTIKLNNNTSIPLIGFGTWQITGQDAYDAVSDALHAGYRHIDTAMIYHNEEEVGRAIADSGIAREELFITTKLWNDDHADVQAAFDLSLQKLGLDYVDLYLMHWPVATRREAYKVMEAIYKSGGAKAIGVSNFTEQHLAELLMHAEIVPVVNQVEFNPFLNQKELKDMCADKNIVIEAYSPLTHANKLDDEKLKIVAAKYKKTPAQILLRWAIQQDVVVIPKSSNPGRIAQNFDLFDFKITNDDLGLMNSWNEDARFCGDPTDMP
jgi:diketogulonate reductase-like aldo/keto reductase